MKSFRIIQSCLPHDMKENIRYAEKVFPGINCVAGHINHETGKVVEYVADVGDEE